MEYELPACLDKAGPQRRKGLRRNRRSVSALSAGAYTTTLLMMVDRVKRGGRAPPPSSGWAEFTIMMECTLKSGHCQSSTLSSVGRHSSMNVPLQWREF